MVKLTVLSKHRQLLPKSLTFTKIVNFYQGADALAESAGRSMPPFAETFGGVPLDETDDPEVLHALLTGLINRMELGGSARREVCMPATTLSCRSTFRAYTLQPSGCLSG